MCRARGSQPIPFGADAALIEVKLADADWQRAEWIGESSCDGVPDGRIMIRTLNGFTCSVHPAATRPYLG